MKEFGYDVEDFREIEPIFWTMEDFENLLSSIQDRGSYCFFVCALQDMIRIWQEKGVDGFQMDVVKFILEAEHLRRASGQSGAKPSDSCCTELCLERVNGSWRPKPTTTKYVNVINMLLLTLPGTPTSYYGEEIGMENTAVSEDHIQDPFGKFDPENITSHSELYHDYTDSQVGLHVILQGWRQVMDEYSTEPGRYRFMVTESYDYEKIGRTMMYYGTSFVKEANFPFNFYQ
ncbi:UNVERIFIED_CONTAM: hypothetical protein FKN15_073701 [Acipenser sinensis]